MMLIKGSPGMPTKKTDSRKTSSPTKVLLSPPDKQENPDTKEKNIKKAFPIVGIGASAGGLAAIEAFFSGMPADSDPGMAFVLVQHLAPDHKSILTELIRRYTRMQVFEVTDGMEIKPNCAYIIPPNRDMAVINGSLQLMKPLAPRGQRLPIDFLFRSLARDQGRRAICIVLSGTGSDGTMGLKAIKGEGGMAMVQTPDSTQYDGMPRSAIATGLVDYQLPPQAMPVQLMAYVGKALGTPVPTPSVPTPKVENALKKIFVLLRVQVGHDFSQYKPNTLLRRIHRRLAVHQLDTMDEYVKFLNQTPVEVEALFRDLLIGVTQFFRDKEAFNVLEQEILPRLFKHKVPDDIIRIWTPGCSTGEESYSLAILMAQAQQILKQHFKVQIFATDIDSRAITTARTGLYPASIAADIPREYLDRYFSAEYDGTFYRISKSIRDLLVFSEQDVIKDPPFSKIDIISCRNLLIYMNADLQKKLIPLFHYALNPGGYLFLGTSETVGEFGDLFTTVNRKMKLYQRRQDDNGSRQLSAHRFVPPITGQINLPFSTAAKKIPAISVPLRELTEQGILQHIAPAAALVDARGNIFYLHGRTGMFLEPAPGECGVSNILKMAREGLQQPLNMALHKAATEKSRQCLPGLRVKTNGDYTTITLTVCPLATGFAPTDGSPLFLVVMETSSPVDLKEDEAEVKKIVLPPDSLQRTHEKAISQLKQQLGAKEEYLQSITEELETSNEELKSSNEEMQSMNEELQSTNEELETSKEELQSVNEELSTVNAELQTKVADLMRLNNDMNNLLAGTGIATVFVDHNLCILRFTPAATGIINLIPSDVGRPVAHVVSNLIAYDSLVTDVQAVLDTLATREVVVQTKNGTWFTLRIHPYRTLDNIIEGVVITFVKITTIEQAKAISMQVP